MENVEALIAEAVQHATVAIEELTAALTALAKAAVSIATEVLIDAVPFFFEERELRAVATDRQWHLMNHGSPKVRKKWRNALRRKARIAEKRHHE